MKTFNQILEEYGIYGYNTISKAILAALVAEEPILLVGEHGTGKTLLAEKLALALRIDISDSNKEFIAYDASKALFEDVVGFPNPESLKEGKLKYIESPLTIWNKKFILIDEISRANPQMQNKWLEVIRSRRIMGNNIPDIRFIFAAMNPLGYLGVNPLDEALADRFFLIVNIPEDFKDNDLRKIINSEDKVATDLSGDLDQMIKKIKNIASQLPPAKTNLIDNFIIDFSRKVNELGISFSPRRAAMMKKALTIFFAIDIFDENENNTSAAENLMLAANYSWNYYVTEDDPETDKLKESFYYASKKITKTAKNTVKNFEKYQEKNKSKKRDSSPKTVQFSNSQSSSLPHDDESGTLTMMKILGIGAEIMTVGFYEMVIKGNSKWESKLEKKL